MPTSVPILEVRGATKRFPGVIALQDVHLALYPGEVLAVIGENGAGKSTLMKILAGVQALDDGQVLVDGRSVVIDSVRSAARLGIALIHQELNLADNLDVGANVFLGREPRWLGIIDRDAIRRDTRQVLDAISLDVSPDAIVATLSIGQQQMVEIAKALAAQARILIMDEPTSSLSRHETETLFRVVHELRARGVSVIYISHRLGEVKHLADRVLVLRDGQNAGELDRAAIDHDTMVRMMVGRELSGFYVRRRREPGPPVYKIDQVVVPAHPHHAISLCLHRGEIVGLAGLVGAGRTELLRVLFGLDPPLGGAVRVDGRPLPLGSSRNAIRAGVALVPEDRKLQGLVLEMTLRENVSLAALDQQRLPLGVRNDAAERRDAADMMDRLRIKAPSDNQVVQYLSGGNQQKVALAKWLVLKPRVLLLDEPTRGIDVGAKREIYALMEELVEAGIAILFVSSDLEEILGMSDRVVVMHEGQLTGELTREALSEEAVMQLATRGAAAAGSTEPGH